MADKNVFTQNFSHQQRVTAHWALQASALILITLAQAAIFTNKNNNGYPHYQSTHSLFGLATYLLTVMATIGGSLTKFSHQLRNVIKPAMIKVGHGFAGITVYLLAMATIFLGINQTFTNTGDDQVKIGIVVAFGITSFYVVSKSFQTTSTRFQELSKKSKK